MSTSLWWRALWHLNRTPLAGAVKAFQRARFRSDVRSRRELAATVPISAEDRGLADQLNREGWALVTEAVDADLLQRMADEAAGKYERALARNVVQQATTKDFWTRLLDEDAVDGAMPTDNPFVRFALQPRILSILAAAYGELPQLDYVMLLLSEGKGKKLSQSQLWHRDFDDIRTIKLYVYFTDVVERADGPFTFLPGPVSDGIRYSLRSHRADADVESRISPGDVREMIAPRLSVFMVETSRCLHMGSRVAIGHDRLMYMAAFISTPRMFPEPPPRFRLDGSENAVTRRVLSSAVAPR